MKRKTFIALSAMSAAILSVPSINCIHSNSGTRRTLSVPGVLSQISDSKTIIEIGQAYGTRVPDEYSPGKIENLLKDGSPISDNSSPLAVHSLIAETIRADFEAGKTIILQGWVLSICEARQCALFSLIHS